MPMAKPINTGSSPPGYLRASKANTGSTKNKPSMRKAKIDAKVPLARRSVGVMEGLRSGREAGAVSVVTAGIVLHSQSRLGPSPLSWRVAL